MAQVPTNSAPSVLPTTNAGNDYQQVNATPAAFGAQIGAAGSQFANTLGQVGQQAAQVAEMQQGIINESAATDASAAFSKAQGDMDAKYYALEGKQAVEAFPVYQQQLSDLRDHTLNSMANPAARQMVSQDISRRVGMAYEGAARFNAQQVKVWSTNASTDRAAVQVNSAMGTNDPKEVEAYIQTGQAEQEKIAELKGYDPDTTKSIIAAYRGQAYSKVIDNLLLKDPFAAQTMFNNVRPSLDAASQLSIAQKLKPAVAKATTDQQFNMLTNQGGAVPGSTDIDTLWNAQKVQESGNKQFLPGTTQPVMSPKGAIGISQIMPKTAIEVENQLGLPNNPQRVMNDPGYNEMLGKQYMQNQLQKYGDPNMALAAYNAGPGAVDAAIARGGDPRNPASGATMDSFLQQLPDETQKYVKSIGASARLSSGISNPVSVVNDFPGLVDKAMQMTQGDPEAQERLLGRLGQWHSAQQTMMSQQKATLARQVENLGPALLNGQDGLVIPEAKIRSLYPSDQADAIVADLNMKQTAGQVFKTVALASPADLADYQKQLVTGNGLLPGLLRGKMNIPVDQTGNVVTQDGQLADMKVRSAVGGMLQTMIAKRQTALNADPASYAVTNDPGVAAAYKDMMAKGDPDSFEQYAQATIATQVHLGVPSYKATILPQGQVQNIVHGLMATDPATTDMGAKVDQLTKQFGNEWPTVFGQMVTQGKLPATWQAVATMNAPGQTAARSDLVRAIQATSGKDAAAFNKLVPKQDMQAIESGLAPDASNAYGNFMQTARLPNAPVSTTQMQGNVRQSVETLAKYYVTQGVPGAEAVTKAADGILGQRYDFDGTIRTPKGMLPQTETYLKGVEQSLQQSGMLMDPGAKAKSPEADLQPEQRAGIVAKADKVWIPNEQDNGLVMLAKMKDGTQVPVRRADGSRVEMHFKDLANATQGQAQPVMPSPGMALPQAATDDEPVLVPQEDALATPAPSGPVKQVRAY